jgi:hypothetical protein
MRQNQIQLHHTYKNKHEEFLQYKIVNDLIYNEPTNLVSLFKDFLIMDDINEFLKRPYYGEESIERIPKLATFYNQTSIIVPNYFALG